ncbi:hypothetical protein IP70_01050 [alpha proteobacterium AAP38]|uniref:hypothetical protein n=1 Tax=Niveispirillum sp. TaxID=1917217 RepID=UPI0006B9C981|nr:hypothetical protein IP70_01050 [alpha proteobacterium AAP38]
MAYAFDDDQDVFPPLLSKDEVEAEQQDWLTRLRQLYSTLEGWLPAGEDFGVTRHEADSLDPVAKKAGVTVPIKVPRLQIEHRSSEKRLQIFPESRWVLLTRGRLFLFHPLGRTYIEDHGAPGVPDWRFYPYRDRSQNAPLNCAEFQNLLDGLR